MVYYKHWGMDEIKMTRKINGLVLTMNKIKTLFIDTDNDDFMQDLDNFLLEVSLMDARLYNNASRMVFINHISNVLLSSMGGSIMFSHDEHTPQWRLACRLGISLRTVYSARLSHDQIRAVDAIVSL